jgi:hypothetical protein
MQGVLEEQMQGGLDGKVAGDVQVEIVEGCQLLTNLGHELEEQVAHPNQVACERGEGGLLEQENQRSKRVWLEGEEGLSLQVELEAVDCCVPEEGEEQNVVGYMMLVWVERQDEHGEKRYEEVKRRDGHEKRCEEVKRQDDQGEKLCEKVVVDGRGK